jgi:Arc/MetJ-type ribon-helix-helix transcriptional regulator
MTVKLSVSLPDNDVAFIDNLSREHDGNRSAAVHHLIQLAREMRAADAYTAAFDEWHESGDDAAWDGPASDEIVG